MTLHLYDSASRANVPFTPLQEGQAAIYVCGPTTQSSPHLGHLRTFLAFDVLVRWLERSGYRVTYVRNVTDIDDKILAKAKENDAEWWAWSLRHELEFGRVMDALGARRPDYEPRATGHVPEMIEFMQRLIERGHAYPDGNGNVYFDVHSFPRYGALTRQDVNAMQDGGDAEAGKRNPADFALWKSAKADEPETASWPTPWGRGRPGWHLECSAMAKKYLGEAFDIHGGGLDLRFPHHENEQAQSWAAGYGFANLWLHSGLVTVDGMKMGKSLNNFITAEDVLSKHSAAAVRLALVSASYGSTLEFNADSIAEAETVWGRFYATVKRASEMDGVELLTAESLPEAFTLAMNDNLNAAGAMAEVHRGITALNAALSGNDAAAVSEKLAEVRGMLDVFGLDPLHAHWRSTGGGDDTALRALDALVSSQIAQRAEARAAKDWARADAIRDALQNAGIRVEDGANGARWSIES
ncbi:cysteine--tRNA ligase [Dermabacteraceae bacterium P13115]